MQRVGVSPEKNVVWPKLLFVVKTFIKPSLLRKWKYFSVAFWDLLFQKKNCHNWMTGQEDHRELSDWELPRGKHYFFDIDDTLNLHRKGLEPHVLLFLNHIIESDCNVILLTNCSPSRAREHHLKIVDSKIELWPVGNKPDVDWLKDMIAERGWLGKDCVMFGDRPSMDLYLATKAGFESRIWVKTWGKDRPWKGPLQWLQKLEWALFS